jgi:putative aldouronate transport system substrate-binding protein
MRKFLFFALSLVLSVAAVYAGGSGQQGGASSSGSQKKEISVSFLDRGLIPASEGTYENNRWTRWVNENSPVRVRWVPVPRTDSGNRINALFAAGTAPDLVYEFGKSFMDNLYAQGVIQPVGDHIKNYSTAYRDYLSKHPELMPFMMEDDGKQYGMTSARNITNIPNHAMWIRQDWLDKFGLAAPVNTDQVVEFMRRVRDQDPDGNGVKDSWGMTFNYNANGIFRALFGEPMGGFKIVDGHFVDWSATPAYRDYLAFRAMLYREGFIDPEYITDANYARQRQLLVTGKAGIYLGSWDMPNEWRELRQNVPGSDWQPLEPWATSQGKHGLFQEPPAHYTICMNQSVRDPQPVMEFVDWLVTDGWFTLLFGAEGRNYRLMNGYPQVIDPDINRIETVYLVDYAILHQFQPATEYFRAQAAQDALSQDYVPVRMKANEIQLKNKFDRLPYTPTSDTINRFSTETANQITAIETNIITGQISVDEGIRQINEYKRSFGWDAVNAEKDAWYQKNKSILQ